MSRQRKPYRKLKKIRREYKKIENATVKKVEQHVNQFRIEVAQRLMDIEWNPYAIDEIKQVVWQTTERFRQNATMEITQDMERAFTKGIKQVDDVIFAQRGKELVLPYITTQTLETTQKMAADLIVGLSQDMAKKVNTQITIGIMGEQSPFQVMKNLETFIPPLKNKKGLRGTAFNRAETITRTEMARVNNTASRDRMKQISEQYPKTKKQWLATYKPNSREEHQRQERLGPILVDDSFNVHGTYCYGPFDPILPAAEVINCGCTLITIFEED